MSKSRTFKYTLNNYTDEELAFVQRLVDPQDVKRHVCGKEVGEAGTPHLQGAITFPYPKTNVAVSKLFPRAHIEPAIVDTMLYELKGESVVNVNHDKRKREARETPFQAYVDDVVAGLRGRDLLQHGSLVMRHPPAAVLYMLDETGQEPRTHCDVELWHGPPGIGKSTRALAENGGALQCYLFDNYTRGWWDGYAGQPTLILDEFACQFPISFMKRLLDKQPLQLEIKHSRAWAKWTKVVIITNNEDPLNDWYRHCSPVDRSALFSRIATVVECRGTNKRPTMTHIVRSFDSV